MAKERAGSTFSKRTTGSFPFTLRRRGSWPWQDLHSRGGGNYPSMTFWGKPYINHVLGSPIHDHSKSMASHMVSEKLSPVMSRQLGTWPQLSVNIITWQLHAPMQRAATVCLRTVEDSCWITCSCACPKGYTLTIVYWENWLQEEQTREAFQKLSVKYQHAGWSRNYGPQELVLPLVKMIIEVGWVYHRLYPDWVTG